MKIRIKDDGISIPNMPAFSPGETYNVPDWIGDMLVDRGQALIFSTIEDRELEQKKKPKKSEQSEKTDKPVSQLT